MRALVGFVTICGGVVVAVPEAAQAANEPVIHFVVDVSGSMSGQKLTEAVEAIKITAEAVPDTTALGLRTYEGSCNQSFVEPLVPIGLDNDEEIIAAADSLVALGGTPTTAALGEGIDELLAYPSSGSKRLVLLTDGDTQCGISVCNFVQQKDLGGVQITLYTVGLQVSSGAAADLTCAAEFTGGSFIAADDPNDLVEALGQATGSREFKYVALGDSFSAGEGIEPFTERNNRCHRSFLAYPFFVEQPGVPNTPIVDRVVDGEAGLQWGFQACSGAETEDVLSTPQWSDPLSQLALDRSLDTSNPLDLPVDDATDLVTITIGGNNVRFSEVLQFCFWSNDCTTEKYKGTSLAQSNRNQRDALSTQLDRVFAQIHAQAPHARILVLGYPQLLPASSAEQNCIKLRQQNYVRKNGNRVENKSFGFSQAEQNYIRQATSELNQLLAARAQANTNTSFIAVDSYFAGHEICGNSGEWINAASLRAPLTHGQLFGTNDQSFHPNADGQRYGYAEAINDWLNFVPEF